MARTAPNHTNSTVGQANNNNKTANNSLQNKTKSRQQKLTNQLKYQQQSQPEPAQISRPKRKATNAHAFRYLQTRNPSRLVENDLKRALEASLEECPDYWPEETASFSSSDQGSATTFSSGRSSSNSNNPTSGNAGRRRRQNSSNCCCSQNHHLNNHNRRSSSKSSLSQPNHQFCNNHPYSFSATTNYCCPMSSVLNRYKPVAKKNIYDEADFFHDGIMEYIEYELVKSLNKKKQILQLH